MPVPPGTRGKQLDVSLQKRAIRVGLKGQEPILAGELAKEIRVDDSTWTLGALDLSPATVSSAFSAQSTGRTPLKRLAAHPLFSRSPTQTTRAK